MTHLYFLYRLPGPGVPTLRGHHDGQPDRAPGIVDLDAGGSLRATAPEKVRIVAGRSLTRGFAEHFPDRRLREAVFVPDPVDVAGLSGPDPADPADHSNPITEALGTALGVPAGKLQLSAILAELTSVWMVATTASIDALVPVLLDAAGVDSVVEGPEVTRERRAPGGSADAARADAVRAGRTEDVALHEACRRLEARTMERLGLASNSAPPRPLGSTPA